MGNILLYGGTFDPPHIGHRHLITHGMKQMAFDRVFLIPAYIPPHKDHEPTLSFNLRKAHLMDYFGDLGKIEILGIEQERDGKSFTIDTVEVLQNQYPDDCFYLLMGTDMFLSFETWHRFEDLLKAVVLVVGAREKGDEEKIKQFCQYLMSRYECKGIILCEMEAVECSSSALRSMGGGLAERALKHISASMDEKRARHSLQVAEYAKNLAIGAKVDPQKAYLAGLLHDCTKCNSADWHQSYAAAHGIELTKEDLASPQILHQITGAIFAKEELGCADEEILSAIACHTTGKAHMSSLDKLLFFADSCEPSRTYDGVEKLRKAGEEDLKYGTLMLLTELSASLIKKNAVLHPQTIEAKESLLKELEKNG